MNLPNKLTILRIVLTLAFIFFLFLGGVSAKVTALAIFILASMTDMLDGFIAKRNNEITDFGKLMDPIADKILVLSAFMIFVGMGIIPDWMVIVITATEVTVTGLRMFARTRNKVISADATGKHKTVWQVFSILAILIFIILNEAGRRYFLFWTDRVSAAYKDLIFAIMLITVLLTLISGVSYLVKNREVYYNEKDD
jgi:CDP-diacylglycerol--glycerol-3-phosphate 3-phosphatidyltransferase